MKNRPLAILLIAIIAFHAFAGGAGDAAVLCLGGGHEHAPAEEEQCELACSHDGSVPLPLQAYSSEHDCDCNDIEFTISDLLAMPRSDDGSAISPVMVFAPVWGVVVADSGLGRRGPPMQSHWIDHGGVHRLEIVTSVRLNI